MKMREAHIAELEAEQEIKAKANTIIIDDFKEGEEGAAELPAAASSDLP